MTTTDVRRAQRLVLAVALAWTLGCSLTACDGGSEGDGPGTDAVAPLTEGGEPADPSSGVDEPPVTAEVSLAMEGDSLVATYTVTHDGAEDVVLVNRLPRPSGAGVTYDDQVAYATGTDARTVTISQRLFATPDSDRIDYAQAPQVGGTVVAPGDAVTVELSVDLPLQRRQPFGDDLGYGTIALPEDADRAAFCLGVLRRSAVAEAPVDDGVVLLAHGPLAAQQHLLCSESLAL